MISHFNLSLVFYEALGFCFLFYNLCFPDSVSLHKLSFHTTQLDLLKWKGMSVPCKLICTIMIAVTRPIPMVALCPALHIWQFYLELKKCPLIWEHFLVGCLQSHTNLQVSPFLISCWMLVLCKFKPLHSGVKINLFELLFCCCFFYWQR